MAREDESSRLTQVSFLLSFWWLSHSLDKHSLIDQPRLSAFLLLFTAGAFVFAVSLFSERLPGADGRFDSDALLKRLKSSLPQRPRRFYAPCIILLIVVRLEILYRVLYDFQCTVQGVEALLPVFLAFHESLFNHKTPNVVSDEPEDMWGSVWDDLRTWLKGSQLTLLFSTLFFSWATFLVADFSPKSSYFCSTVVDQTPWVVFIQWLGVFIDAAILILLWRVLSWQRTTKSRLRSLSDILTASSASAGLLWVATRFFQRQSIMSTQAFRGLNSLYIFDVLTVGGTAAILAISTTLWICESAPLRPVAIVTFVGGLWTTLQNIWVVGTYRQVSTAAPLVVLGVISVGFSIFTYAINMRSVIFVPRMALIVLLVGVISGTTTYSLLQNKPFARHPVDELVYRNRVETDRWLRHATVSTTLKLAVSEYKERQHGRDPPANFDKWFDFALQRQSAIMDKFDQIGNDIFPFWGIRPQRIRDNLEIVKALPDVAVIDIARGKVSHNLQVDSLHKQILDEAVSMISTFSDHLPDMSFVVNLNERPRILAPWDDIRRLTEAAGKSKFSLLSHAINKRQAKDTTAEKEVRADVAQVSAELANQPYISSQVFRRLQALACPPGSRSRVRVNWNVRDLCTSCAGPHSLGHFLRDWEKSLDLCHQPDIFYLHDFHTQPHQLDLHQDLLPLFSRSKPGGFNDILIPLIRPNTSTEPDKKDFDEKIDLVFWQDEPIIQPVTHQTLHGGHRNRLIHMNHNAMAADKISMLLGVKVNKEDKFRYEEVSVRNANGPLPLFFSFRSPEKCDTQSCQLALREFGFQPHAMALDNRYIMHLDTANGPSPETLTTLRSNSVPVISSIFREWYTERIMPWTHFVPVDLRYHGLHSTLAYFIGLKDRDPINGREQTTEPKLEDARWIAEQGRKWAEKALRREDMEIYLFRLLLEWGRVISDDRDRLGFVLKDAA